MNMAASREPHKFVPTTLVENLRFRRDLLKRCEKSKAWREMVIKACRKDPIFFFNAFCLAAGTRVVTDRGLVPIESVTCDDRVWDGERWVSTDGALCMGQKEVIIAYGLSITPEHKVWTKYGWQVASDRYDREEVRTPYGCSAGRDSQEEGNMALPVRLRERSGCLWGQPAPRQAPVVRMQQRIAPQARHASLLCLECDDSAVQEPKESSLCELRIPWDFSLREMGEIQGLLQRHGRSAERTDDRANRQRRQLRTRQLQVGNTEGTAEQPESVKTVYDLINCGPNQSFTVVGNDGRPLLVHNCWCSEPRPRFWRCSTQELVKPTAGDWDDGDIVQMPTSVPFITWEHQYPVIKKIHDNLGSCDIGVTKSRGEGASWIGVLLAMKDFLFYPGATIGLVSKDEASVDNPNDPDSLFWKLDFELKMLPDWMTGYRDTDWKRNLNDHTLVNRRIDSAITGYAATGNVASGGRKRWMLQDELAKFPRPADRAAMASTQYVTDCRLIVSTPLGSDGAYYSAMHEPSNMVKLVLDWKDNPTRNKGMYRLIEGKPIAEDPVNDPLPEDYEELSKDIIDMYGRLRRKGFNLEGKLRSPWYDRECDRTGATPQNIAQELDRDYGGSAYRVFGDAFFDKSEKSVIVPTHTGDLNFGVEDLDRIRFDHIDSGPLKLWCPLDSLGNPPQSRYVFGCDVSTGSAGTYTSNSAIVGMDQLKQEQILEFALNSVPPAEFADLCIAICKWFHNAYLIWEHGGPGTAMTKHVLERGYGNIYYRRSYERRGGVSTKEAGWVTTAKTKEVMFSDFGAAVILSKFTIRSKELHDECGKYVRKGPQGAITNSLILNATDDAKGASHGDRTIAAAVMIQGGNERPVMENEAEISMMNPPEGSMAARMKEYDEQQAALANADGWDDRTLDVWM